MTNSIQNTLPTPTVLSAPMLPPITSTNCFDTTRPRPVPSSSPASCPRRLNGWKSCTSCSGNRPLPVSRTLIRIESGTFGLRVQPTATAPPGLLYLIALKRRLSRTCLTFVRSPLTKQGISNCGNVMVTLRFLACAWARPWHSSITSPKETGSCNKGNLPDSITARLKIWLVSSSR